MFEARDFEFGNNRCINVFENCTRPNIAFVVILLVRFSAKLTKWQWIGVKPILQYLKGTEDIGLFYRVGEDNNIKGYMDMGYLSDPHLGNSQTCYGFFKQGATISWKSTKQSLCSHIFKPFKNYSHV